MPTPVRTAGRLRVLRDGRPAARRREPAAAGRRRASPPATLPTRSGSSSPPLFECLLGAMGARLDGARLDAEELRGLLLRQVLEVSQDEHGALARWEPVERLAHVHAVVDVEIR